MWSVVNHICVACEGMCVVDIDARRTLTSLFPCRIIHRPFTLVTYLRRLSIMSHVVDANTDLERVFIRACLCKEWLVRGSG